MTFFIALEIVLWWKNWFMRHFYSPCFEYLEKGIFFLQVIQTQLFVSQGNIKFDKKVKIQVLQTLEGILYESFTHYWPEKSFTGASSRFCKMTQIVRPLIDGRFIIYFHPNDSIDKMTQIVRPLIHGRFIKILQNDANRPTLHLWVLASFCIKILMKLPYDLRHFAKSWWSAHQWGFRQFASF